MLLFSSFISNALVITAAFLFYQKIIVMKLKLGTFCVSILFASYMILSHGLINEPWRLVLGLVIVLLVVKHLERKILWGLVITSFLYSYLLLFIVNIATPFILVALTLNPEMNLAYLLLLSVEVSVYCFAYKKTELIEGLRTLEEKGTKGLLITIAVLVLTLYSGLHGFMMFVDRISTRLHGVIFWFQIFILVIVIVLTIYLARYVIKKQKEFHEFAAKNSELVVDLKGVTRLQHKYRHVVPALEKTSHRLIKRLEAYEASDDETQALVKAVGRLSSEIATEFFEEDLKIEIQEMRLPIDLVDFGVVIEILLQKARKNKVRLFIDCTSVSWSKVPEPRTEFIRLIGNLIDNAIKETAKLGLEEADVVVTFSEDEDGDFIFVVRDDAKEFPLSILSRLGGRGVSTNGTGDGYSEIFNCLTKMEASFWIKEWKSTDKDMKKIIVVFNGLGSMHIESAYRQEELEIALADSVIEVI